jgi:CRP/FNR family cyclic AMP-dependent transcriptional regulator
MKSLIEKAFFLKKSRLFNELDLEVLLAVAEKLHEDAYEKDEKVFTPGQVANRVYLIFEGSVQILDEHKRHRCDLGPGDYFGDESLFNDQPRSYSAICKSDTIFFTLSRSHLLSIISECPSVAITLLQSYSQQLPCRYKS